MGEGTIHLILLTTVIWPFLTPNQPLVERHLHQHLSQPPPLSRSHFTRFLQVRCSPEHLADWGVYNIWGQPDPLGKNVTLYLNGVFPVPDLSAAPSRPHSPAPQPPCRSQPWEHQPDSCAHPARADHIKRGLNAQRGEEIGCMALCQISFLSQKTKT